MKSIAADRLACVDLPAFPLQLLLRRHPQWRTLPTAVVSRQTPQGKILIPSRKAQKKGIVAGLSYGTALGLVPELRADTVSQADMDNGKATVIKRLIGFSPKVQAQSGYPGSFWLNASGLERIYPSLHTWGNTIHATLRRLQYYAVIVIGFSPFGTFALARRAGRKIVVLDSMEQETARARSVLLKDVGISGRTIQELSKLGQYTVGDLLDLPAEDLLQRYGPVVYRIRRLAANDLQEPMVPERLENAPVASLLLDTPETDVQRLTFVTKGLLRKLLSKIAARHESLAGLEMTLQLDNGRRIVDFLQPAQPTLDERQLIDLIRLRLGHTSLESGVMEIQLDSKTVPATTRQLPLFVERSQRDLEAASRALARLRAELGPEAVVQIKVHSGHLPDACFSFRPVSHAVLPDPIRQKHPTLVRRIFIQPRPLKRCPIPRQDGGLESPVHPYSHVHGPYIFSGGWWRRAMHRAYYFVQTKKGQILWVYFDGNKRWWFVHGTVE